MGLFRFASLVAFLAAAASGFGWPFRWQLDTDLALIAVGLFFYVLSGFTPATVRFPPPMEG